MVVTKISECMICTKIKDYLTEHHVKECSRKIMMVCDDCYKVITWYLEKTSPKFKKELKKKK